MALLVHKRLAGVLTPISRAIALAAGLRPEPYMAPFGAEDEPFVWTLPNPPRNTRILKDLEFARTPQRPLYLDLYLPERRNRPFPVIVWIHGGGWLMGGKEYPQAGRMAERGYAVASIQYRFSGDARFPAQIQDAKAAVRWLRAHAKEDGLNAERRGAWGHSSGAHLVALLGTTGERAFADAEGENQGFSSRLQAACTFSGPSDFLLVHELPDDTAKAEEVIGYLLGGPLREKSSLAKQASPVNHVTSDACPFLVMHGESDPIVPCSQATHFHRALRDAGVDAQLHIVKGGDHVFGGREVDAMVDAFFDRHLMNHGIVQ